MYGYSVTVIIHMIHIHIHKYMDKISGSIFVSIYHHLLTSLCVGRGLSNLWSLHRLRNGNMFAVCQDAIAFSLTVFEV